MGHLRVKIEVEEKDTVLDNFVAGISITDYYTKRISSYLDGSICSCAKEKHFRPQYIVRRQKKFCYFATYVQKGVLHLTAVKYNID